MTKRKQVFITSLIVLLIAIAGGFYYLFFSGKLGTLADLVTGPNERVVASKQADEIFDSALSKINLKVEDDRIVLDNPKSNGLLIDEIDVGDLDFVRRFLWESEVPEGADLRVSIKTSPDGENWDEEWSEVSEEDWYYIDIDKPAKKVMYMAEFSQSKFDYGFNVDNLDRSVDELKDKESIDTQQEGDIEKAYLHLYQGGKDRGRYLGSSIDNSGMAQDLYYFTMLTDQMAFVSERYRGKREGGDYTKAFSDFIKSSNIELFFVDESKQDPSQKILGEARIAKKDQGESSWADKGKYLNSLVDISGKHSDKVYPITVSIADDYFKFKGVDVGKKKTISDLNIYRGKKDDWSAKTENNTKKYQNLDSVKSFQENLRVKFDPLQDDIDSVDEFAKLEVNQKDQGYYIGSGVNISGAHSDVFFPLWISSEKAWVGAGELIPHVFFETTRFTNMFRARTPQDSEQNSRDFSQTESVQMLRGNFDDDKDQELAISVEIETTEEIEEPSICQDFDKLVIEPESANIGPGADYQFDISALDTKGNKIDLGQLDYNLTTNGGSIDRTGNYQATTEEGEYQITFTSSCDGETTADVVVSDEFDQPITTNSPQLLQVGVSSGYSVDDDQEEDVDQPKQEGSPDQIPGWVKGSLVNTGTDLIVLIVVTIMIVVGLVYLVGLLKKRDGLSEVDSISDKEDTE